MNWFTGIVVYILIWWTLIFAVLPWGLKRDRHGRPDDPRLKSKILITSLLSLALWCMVYALEESGAVSFREMAARMMQGDMDK